MWDFLFADVLAMVALLILKRTNFLIFGFCVLFLIVGILRIQIIEFNIASDKLSKLNGVGKVELVGVVYDEPDVRDKSQNLKVKVDNSVILVTTAKYPEYNYFDKVKLTGKLETPKELEDFNYKNYLMKDGIYSVMAFPKIELARAENKNFIENIYSFILVLKDKLRQSIRNNFSPPHSLILEGTVLGDNGVMSEDLKNKLNITGLRHVIAVSGTHIVILSAMLMSLLLAIGLWRGQAFYFSVAIIWFYIVLTGLCASGIRAGIMGTLYLLAQKLGRQSMGVRVIMIAAAIMLLANPLLLFYDIGFQLSFLAVLGLIYLDPIIRMFLNFVTKEKVKSLTSILSATFSAQIFTLPVMLYNFGNISLIAPITNILILPTVPLMMGFGFVASFVGIVSRTLGWVLSVPCYILLEYFVKILDIFSQPWAMKTFENVHWIWVIVLYVIIVSVQRYLYKKYLQTFV